MPALRISARSVPTESSLCCGMDRLTRTPGFVSKMAAHLFRGKPAGFGKRLGGFLAGNIPQASHY